MKEKKCNACGESSCKCCPRKKCGRKVALCVAALILASGPMVAGYFVSQGLKSGHVDDRSIELMVASEKEVKADFVVWRIPFQDTSSNIGALREKYVKDRDAILAYLKEKGFKDEEIDKGSPQVTDLQSLEWKEKHQGDRYIIKSNVKITSHNVGSVDTALAGVSDLMKQGILLTQEESVNPKYFLKDSLALERELYDDALHQGKELAKQIAGNLGVKLGNLRQCTQGEPMHIFGNEDTSDSYNSAFKGPVKIARLNVKIKFDVK